MSRMKLLLDVIEDMRSLADSLQAVATALCQSDPEDAAAPAPAQEGTLAERMDAYEGQIIRESYRRWGTTVAVAKELGISQATAARKVAKYVK